ncbi:hypothetical protein CKAH01_07976 [Colletotrichum kahawae]|uniref:Uncharacterized protein n=1 Tax=Colletotrichum kahawae TaxID=34407 RepID=A0AAE0D0N7_COLKA|nr:hypothetical protein CKAH01_07976 [Colletotrichum kahawae]
MVVVVVRLVQGWPPPPSPPPPPPAAPKDRRGLHALGHSCLMPRAYEPSQRENYYGNPPQSSKTATGPDAGSMDATSNIICMADSGREMVCGAECPHGTPGKRNETASKRREHLSSFCITVRIARILHSTQGSEASPETTCTSLGLAWPDPATSCPQHHVPMGRIVFDKQHVATISRNPSSNTAPAERNVHCGQLPVRMLL